jgi:hypothetical protein
MRSKPVKASGGFGETGRGGFGETGRGGFGETGRGGFGETGVGEPRPAWTLVPGVVDSAVNREFGIDSVLLFTDAVFAR